LLAQPQGKCLLLLLCRLLEIAVGNAASLFPCLRTHACCCLRRVMRPCIF
jgi:hypothetical protein